MRIWIDADACPNVIKEVLFKAAERLQVRAVLVANQYVRTPPSRFISCLQVEQGFDVADDRIVAELTPGDLVITADVPLADEVIAAGAFALNPRGTLYTAENVKSHLSRRDLLAELRDGGMVSGGPPPLDKKDVQQFANALDRFLAANRP